MTRPRLPRGARAVSPSRVAVEQAGARAERKKSNAETLKPSPTRTRVLVWCRHCRLRSITEPGTGRCPECGGIAGTMPGTIEETIA